MIKKVNKGAESDYRASKLDKLAQVHRDVRDGASFQTDGFAQEDFACLTCGFVRQLPKAAAYQRPAPCSQCQAETLHERV